METSIIIRTKNEQKWVGTALEILSNQTYKNFEVVIVDSGSTDKTLNIIKNFNTKLNIKLIEIKPEEFSFPHALNIGCQNAGAKKYFVFMSAHCLPISNTWLEDGLKNFTNDNIFGVYGHIQALPDGSIWEKIIFSTIVVKLLCLLKIKTTNRKATMGIMGFTNAIIRREFWDRENFDENYGYGGEDHVWNKSQFQKGYIAIKDPKFSVAHSHGLGLLKFIKQVRYWDYVSKNPCQFKPVEFRKE